MPRPKDREPKRDIRRAFHSFRLEGESGSTTKRIYIDGVEMKGVVSAAMLWDVNEVPRVFLEFISDDVTAEEPIAAVLPYRKGEDETDDHHDVPGVRERSDNGNADELPAEEKSPVH
jgi:hypothetical protein